MSNWAVVRIFGPNCIRAVEELAEAGAIMYCPVVKTRKRVGRARSATVVAVSPAYQGWAFMAKPPEPGRLAPWVRYRALNETITQDEIDRVRSEEALWNQKFAESESPSAREPWPAGTQVVVQYGLLKDHRMVVEKDLGDRAIVKSGDPETSTPVSISTFLLEEVRA